MFCGMESGLVPDYHHAHIGIDSPIHFLKKHIDDVPMDMQ